jgi:threonine/homoserine/homoserine lactone efflux protein
LIDAWLFLGFCGAALLCIATPGPDSLGTIAMGAAMGPSAGRRFGLGVAAGAMTHTLWAALGISALIAASPALFTALKLLGAAYLLYLGVMAWRAPAAVVPAEGAPAPAGGASPFWRGFVSNALNPKVALFFLAFVPPFVDVQGGPVFAQMLLLGSTFAAMTALAYGALGGVAGRVAAPLVQRPGVARLVQRVCGTLFVVLAARLLWPERRA